MKSLLILFFTLFSFLGFAQDLTEVQKQQLDVNYLVNGGFENGKSGWALYNDGASATPVDGAGGTASITLTTSTNLPHQGRVSGVLTKDAVNRQGQGLSRTFTIPDVAKGKVIRLNFSYEITSGIYANSDMSIWIYDVTNSRLIQPSAYTIENSALKETKFVEWQSSIDSNSYRLIVHVTSTSASAYTLKFDSFSVGLTPKIYGSVTTDWQVYTPTFTGLGTPASHRFSWRRVGDSVEIQGTMVTGTTSAVEARISLPSGLVSANSTLLPALQMVGKAGQSGSATTYFGESVLVEPNTAYLTFGRQDSTNTEVVKALGTNIAGTGTTFAMFAKVPIQGWSSSQQLSQDADTRVVSAKYTTNQARTSTGTPFNYETKIFDTHNAVTTGASWKFTAPISGIYRVSAGFIAQSTSGVNNLYVYKNNVIYDGGTLAQQVATNVTVRGTTLIEMKAGDFFHLSNGSASTATLTADSFINSIEVERLSGPSQIAASESVGMSYGNGAGTTVNTSFTTLVFPTKVSDSHGAWNGSEYTCPMSGEYLINLSLLTATATYANGGIVLASLIYVNGSFVRDFARTYGTGASINYKLSGSTKVRCLAGQKISIQITSSASVNLFPDAQYNYMDITRVGNY